MPRHANLAEALRERARDGGDHTVALAHPDGTGGERRISYAELDARAAAVAAWLRGRDAAGRRVLIVLDPGPHIAAALLGCLYAGAVAVPVPAPTASRTAAERTAAIAKDAAVDLVLTETAHATETSRRLSLVGRADLTCLPVDRLGPDGGTGHTSDAPSARTDPDSLALLAYDSGPATAPRGARLTHGNLLAAMHALRATLGTGPRSRIGGWLPRRHTPGLIGQVLHPLWLGATAVPLPARPFRTDPAAWLRAISRHGITEAVAPDTQYARCAALTADEQPAGLDLSRWRTALNAGEPVSSATMAAFTRRYAAAGLRTGTPGRRIRPRRRRAPAARRGPGPRCPARSSASSTRSSCRRLTGGGRRGRSGRAAPPSPPATGGGRRTPCRSSPPGPPTARADSCAPATSASPRAAASA
ncbi:AMP-binding protein [Streptomyces himastatinicus]|uniref:AMP-binding protein n=1 Tax=Streptomyces himastatinicus TaxID=998084 RepID=UPI0001B4C12A